MRCTINIILYTYSYRYVEAHEVSLISYTGTRGSQAHVDIDEMGLVLEPRGLRQPKSLSVTPMRNIVPVTSVIVDSTTVDLS